MPISTGQVHAGLAGSEFKWALASILVDP